MKDLKEDFDFFVNYNRENTTYRSSWHYKWLFFRYLITRSGLFVLGLRLGYGLHRMPRLRAFYFFFFNIFWRCDVSPRATIGPGLYFPHPFGIVIGGLSVIGGNCVIFNDVTFGKKYPGTNDGMPTIGKTLIIGAGARLLGAIKIEDDVVVGCNSVVTKSIPAQRTVVGVNKISLNVYSR